MGQRDRCGFVFQNMHSSCLAWIPPRRKSQSRARACAAWSTRLNSVSRTNLATHHIPVVWQITKAKIENIERGNNLLRVANSDSDAGLRGVMVPKDIAFLGFSDASFASRADLASQRLDRTIRRANDLQVQNRVAQRAHELEKNLEVITT